YRELWPDVNTWDKQWSGANTANDVSYMHANLNKLDVYISMVVDVQLWNMDLIINTYTSGGCVDMITHISSGLTVAIQDERSQQMIFPQTKKIENINDQYWTLRVEKILEEEKTLTKEPVHNQMMRRKNMKPRLWRKILNGYPDDVSFEADSLPLAVL
ncbi:hypothetical protein Tco_1172749, partial [Tanacetum coccineum]